MSYLDDYNDRNYSKKIPYDDIPISRRPSNSKKYSGSSSSSSKTISSYKILISLIVILVIVNVALIISTFYFLKHSVVKNVNVNYNQINASVGGDITTEAAQTATWGSVAIAAGAGITDAYTFYNNRNGISRGSGVILKKSNGSVYILTCYHVVDGREDKVFIIPYSALSPIKVDVVGYSARYDIAVLKARDGDLFDGAIEVNPYDSRYLSIGENVFAVGNSLGLGVSVYGGLVSRLGVRIINESKNELHVIQTSAEINPGSSGGGLFNSRGEFIGIVNAKTHSVPNNPNITAVGMAYAIPGTFAIGIAESIIANNGTPVRVNLGVEFDVNYDYGITSERIQYENEMKIINRYYCEVSSIVGGSIASKALNVGDMIKSFTYTDRNGVVHTDQMLNPFSFEEIMFSIKDYSDITFDISRHAFDMRVTINASSFTTN